MRAVMPPATTASTLSVGARAKRPANSRGWWTRGRATGRATRQGIRRVVDAVDHVGGPRLICTDVSDVDDKGWKE